MDRVQAKSIRSLASLVGRGASTVRKWIERDSWPFRRTPPWDVAKVRAWMEIHLKPDPVVAYEKRARLAEAGTGEFREMTPLGKARLQATIERALLLRQQREIAAGKFHRVDLCDERHARQILAVKARLMEVGRSLSKSLEGRTAAEIETILADWATRTMAEFSAGEAGG